MDRIDGYRSPRPPAVPFVGAVIRVGIGGVACYELVSGFADRAVGGGQDNWW